MRWISSTDLENWASRRDCQAYLPLVIRRLIRATISRINFISFPAGDSIIYPGWDGRLESKEKTEYIPMGLSVWEIGTNRNIKNKAEDDYQKRKKNSSSLNPSEITFIFITPRIWSKKDKWIKEKNKEKFWKDVRAYDARDLEEWIEQAPAVGSWLAKYIGIYPGNVMSLEDWWNEWSQMTKTSLIPDLILAGRKKQMKQVKNWLNSDPSFLVVQALTKDEAIAFISSIIFKMPENEKEYFFSKSIIIFDQDSFRHIITTYKNGLLLIPQFEEIEIVASQHMHHIFIPLSSDNTVIKEKITLPRPKREEFISALIKMGIPNEDAEKYSKDTARNLIILRRRLSSIIKQPEWAKPDSSIEILPALLVGEWNENVQGDREIMSEISGISYDTFITSLRKWLHYQDSPILKISEIWRLTSSLDAFFILSPFLIRNNFDKFREILLKVLREIDPSLDIEPEKRWMASVYGKKARYSKTLREGIVKTLILIGIFGDNVNLDLPNTSQTWVDIIVWELLNKADWKLWYSLSDVLPLIAEASPSSFLNAVENSLLKNSLSIMRTFSETKDVLRSDSPYSSLLWALECLAWDPNLLGRITLILGKLARLDLGGKSTNRPMNSLRAIFHLQVPQTYAILEKRLQALDILLKKEPEVGWKLLIKIMPRFHDTCTPTHKTCWRRFLEKTNNRITINEYLESIGIVVDKLLENVDNNEEKWIEIMKYFHNLPPQEREKILKKLSEYVNLIKNDQIELWNKLRDILSHHRSFPDAKWVLPEEDLKEIERIFNKLKPADKIKRYLWLFDDHLPNFFEGKEKDEYKKLEQFVAQQRIEAAQFIKDDLGIDGLIKLAIQAENPKIVGNTIAELPLTDSEEQILLSLLDTEDKKKITFIQGYIFRKSSKNVKFWIKKFVDLIKSQQWSSRKIVNFILALPQNRRVWDLLEKFDKKIQEEYWRKVQIIYFSLPKHGKIYALKKLMDVERHSIAIKAAAIFSKELPPELIIKLLKKIASEDNFDDFQNISHWDIEKLFRTLDQSKEVKKEEIAELEWLYLPILVSIDNGRSTKILHKKLSKDPEFFAEIIKYVYRPKNGGNNEEEENLPQELKEHRAHLAWELLNTWNIIPGSDDNGKVDYQKLKTWVNKAREICKKLDRMANCDINIGKILAQAIQDENGNWPPEEICRIIDETASKELDDGFIVGICNKRGVVIRSPFEGGKQERILSKQYQKYAKKWAILFPRTSAILKTVAENYENDAKREDKEAERRDIEW